MVSKRQLPPCPLQWVVVGPVDVNTGGNASAGGGEGGDDDVVDEGVNDEAKRVVDVIDTFRLQVGSSLFLVVPWGKPAAPLLPSLPSAHPCLPVPAAGAGRL